MVLIEKIYFEKFVNQDPLRKAVTVHFPLILIFQLGKRAELAESPPRSRSLVFRVSCPPLLGTPSSYSTLGVRYTETQLKSCDLLQKLAC